MNIKVQTKFQVFHLKGLDLSHYKLRDFHHGKEFKEFKYNEDLLLSCGVTYF